MAANSTATPASVARTRDKDSWKQESPEQTDLRQRACRSARAKSGSLDPVPLKYVVVERLSFRGVELDLAHRDSSDELAEC